MEQRIRIIWILSLTSMLLIVAGQGYWLWNQCQYRNEELVKDVYAKVLEAVALNDSVRALQPRKVFGDSASVSWGTSSKRVIESQGKPVFDYEQRITVERPKAEVTIVFDSLEEKLPLFSDTIRFSTKEELGWNLEKEVAKYMLQVDVPFTLLRFDSILAAKLPGASFETRLCVSRDSLFVTADSVVLAGSRLYPVMEVTYPYNPLGWQQVQITVRPQLQTLLLRMGWQLLGSFLLILLLAVCLLFQIKTILKQQRIDELRKSFVNTMIHELKRPVQALKMCVAFLNDKAMRTDEQTMDEVVRDSMSELDNLSAYLQKLRDMTRADDEQTQLSLSTFDLKPVVEKLIRLQHVPEGRQIFFATRFTDNLLVTADPVHISNIISNLMENAVKYSGTSVHIFVDCALHDHRLTIKVTDDGIGIPASEQSRVFDKFYRSSNLSDRALPGIGLGLSYVKLLVEAHRGVVFLTSQIGKGTTVEISIPQ